MRPFFYTLLAVGATLLLAPGPASASRSLLGGTPAITPSETPAEAQRKGATRAKAATEKKTVKKGRSISRTAKKTLAKLNQAMSVMLGMQDSKHVVSPLKRDWQLHQIQRHLRIKTRLEANAHRSRCAREMN